MHSRYFVAASSCSLTPSLLFLIKKNQNDTPLDVDLVIESIADFLWNKSPELGGVARPFVIKGSYAAAVWAQEHDYELTLPYNDIDVFIEAPAGSDKCPSKSGMVKSSYEKGVIPDSDTSVQVTVLCKLDADDLIKRSDINAVNVGFKVVPKKESGKETAEIDSWSWTPHFETFLKTKTLEIVYSNGQIQSSFIRLLYKSQCMNNMKYKLPEDHDDELHGAVVPPNWMKSFFKLDEEHKEAITNRFSLVPVPQHENWFMYVLKGKETPDFPRKLQNQYYNYSGFNPQETTTSSALLFTKVFTALVAAVAVALMA